jgi:hypothetical protein
MNLGPFVIAAYVLAVSATIALVWASYTAMRRAEAEAAALRSDRGEGA